jgi:hypothetical protein
MRMSPGGVEPRQRAGPDRHTDDDQHDAGDDDQQPAGHRLYRAERTDERRRLRDAPLPQ